MSIPPPTPTTHQLQLSLCSADISSPPQLLLLFPSTHTESCTWFLSPPPLLILTAHVCPDLPYSSPSLTFPAFTPFLNNIPPAPVSSCPNSSSFLSLLLHTCSFYNQLFSVSSSHIKCQCGYLLLDISPGWGSTNKIATVPKSTVC